MRKRNNVNQDLKPTFTNLQVQKMQIVDIERHTMMISDKNTPEN